jgi:enamine deaminase RidA (YjgF/YER057c/UK114 family)
MTSKKSDPIRIFSGAPWESTAGYCRAIQVGPHIEVSGTTSVSEQGDIVGAGDVYKQTRRCFEIIARALAQLGADLTDVTRTRMYTTDITLWEQIAQAHLEVFKTAPPSSTLVEVSRLIHPDLLIEIEATAYRSTGPGDGM